MHVWAKMIKALQGSATELGGVVIDAQALNILDQEVREASESLLQSKQALAGIMGKRKLSEQRCTELRTKITENEEYALLALEKEEEQLALEVAEKIAQLEQELREEESLLSGYSNNVVDLREAVKLAEQNIKCLKQQVDTIRATENVQRAQAAMAQRYHSSAGNSKLRTAMDSLETIKQKQQERAAQMEAADELFREETDDPLMEKLTKAGIISEKKQARDILARLKASAAKRNGKH